MLGVLLIVFEAAAKAASGEKHLAGLRIVAMRFLAREGFARDFIEESFADADTGNHEAANVQIAAEDEKYDGGDTHDVGAIAANSEDFHAIAEIALEKIRKALAEERKFKRGETVLARAGRDIGEGFGVAAESDGNFIGEIGALRETRFEKCADVAADLFRLKRPDDTVDVKCGQKANRADG